MKIDIIIQYSRTFLLDSDIHLSILFCHSMSTHKYPLLNTKWTTAFMNNAFIGDEKGREGLMVRGRHSVHLYSLRKKLLFTDNAPKIPHPVMKFVHSMTTKNIWCW